MFLLKTSLSLFELEHLGHLYLTELLVYFTLYMSSNFMFSICHACSG